jgi:hypothetical protein
VTLPTDHLTIGAIYEIQGRWFPIGIWTGTGFIGCKETYGTFALAQEFHYETGSPDGTAFAVRRLGQFVAPSPWDGDLTKALLDAATDLHYDLLAYKRAAAHAGLELVDSDSHSETQVFKEKQ